MAIETLQYQFCKMCQQLYQLESDTTCILCRINWQKRDMSKGEHENPPLNFKAKDSAKSTWDLTRDHPDTYADWKYEVSNDDTVLGFKEYLEHRQVEEKSK